MRAGDTRHAITHLTQLHRLARTVDQSSDTGYGRLAWTNTVAYAWATAFDFERNLVSAQQHAGSGSLLSVDKSCDRQARLENGLAKSITSLCEY